MAKEEIDVWVPETRLGYFKLFYFGMLVARFASVEIQDLAPFGQA